MHGENMLYERTVNVDNKFVSLKIMDTTGKLFETKVCDTLEKNNWIPTNYEVFIVMYSVTDTKSFELAKEALRTLTNLVEKHMPTSPKVEANGVENSTSSNGPLLYLVGNKTDLSHSRCVAFTEGQKISLSNMETTFFECSTANGPDDAVTVYTDVLQKVLRRNSLLPRASLSGSLTALSSWSSSSNPPRRNTFTASGSTWWRRHRNSNEQNRTDRTFTM
ncbi:Ras-related and estrogen-regulated growth inhibitor [Halotydeus destructor]|nr:Ras-related and estrogen-regulated growth inhibitor [Halotydeus destructor]